MSRRLEHTDGEAPLRRARCARAARRRPARSRGARRDPQATSNCWLQVVNDWLAHGQIEGTLRHPLLHAGDPASERLPRHPAVLERDRRHPARAARRHPRGARQRPRRQPADPGGGGRPRTTGGGGTPHGRRQGGGRRRAAPSARSAATSTRANAQSIPLPLIVLGGLAALLLLAGAGDVARASGCRPAADDPGARAARPSRLGSVRRGP